MAKGPDPRVERERQKIARDTAHAVRALRTIYSRCTWRERIAGRDLGERDGKGFQPVEMGYMIRLHEELEAAGWRPTPYQADVVRARMKKYSRQLVAASQEREKPRAPEKGAA